MQFRPKEPQMGRINGGQQFQKINQVLAGAAS